MDPSLEQTLADTFKYLGPRDRTISEVRGHLQRTNVSAELIDAAVAQLSSQGYLDDARYARCFAEDRRNLDNWGSERIQRRLVELGIAPELADSAAQPEDEQQELAGALECLRRRVRVIPTDPRARQRAMEMLMRRGYEWELAYSAVRRFEEQAA